MRKNKVENLLAHVMAGEGIPFTTEYYRSYDGGNYGVFGCYPHGIIQAETNGRYGCIGERYWQYNFTGTHGYTISSGDGSDPNVDPVSSDANEGLRLYIDTLRNRFKEDVIKVSAKKVNGDWNFYSAPLKGYEGDNVDVVHHRDNASIGDTLKEIDNKVLNKYWFRPYNEAWTDTFQLTTNVKANLNTTTTSAPIMQCSVYNQKEGYKIKIENLASGTALKDNNNNYSLDVSDEDVEALVVSGIFRLSMASGFTTYETAAGNDVSLKPVGQSGNGITFPDDNNHTFTGHFGVQLYPSAGPFNAADGTLGPGQQTVYPKPDTNTVAVYPYVYADCLDSSYSITAWGYQLNGHISSAENYPIPTDTWYHLDSGASYDSRFASGISVAAFNTTFYSYRFAWSNAPRGIREAVNFSGLKILNPSPDGDYLRDESDAIELHEKPERITTYEDYISTRLVDTDNSEWPMLESTYSFGSCQAPGDTLVFFRDIGKLSMTGAPEEDQDKILMLSADMYYYCKSDDISNFGGVNVGSYSYLKDHEPMCNRVTYTPSRDYPLDGSIKISNETVNLHRLTGIRIEEVTDSDFVDSDTKLALNLKLASAVDDNHVVVYEPIVGSYVMGPGSSGRHKSCSAVYYDRYNEEYKQLLEISTDTIDIRKNINVDDTGNHDCVLKEIVFEYDYDPKGETFQFILDWKSMVGADTMPLTRFFEGEPNLSGSFFYLGKEGLYEDIVSYEKYNNLNDFYPSSTSGVPYESREDHNYYYVADCVSMEYGIEGKLFRDGDPAPISENLKLMWFMVLDKSDGNIPSGVQIEMLDMKGIEGDDEVYDLPLIDATERLKQSSGVYKSIESTIAEVQTNDSMGLNNYFELINKNFDRVHVAFRLITTDDTPHLSQAGYRVHLCCRMMNGSGKFNDFVVKTVKVNPTSSLTYCDTNYYTTKAEDIIFFAYGRKETEKAQFGEIYSTNDFNLKAVSAYVKKTYKEGTENKFLVEYAEPTGYAYEYDNGNLSAYAYDNPTDNKLYYIAGKWKNEGIADPGGQYLVNVLYETGCYFKCYPSDFNFDYSDLKAYDSISYTNDAGYTSANDPSEQLIDTHKTILADNNEVKIFDIETQEGAGKYNIRFFTEDNAMKALKVRSGTKSAEKKPIYDTDQNKFVDVEIDGNRILTRQISTGTERYIHLFLSIDDQGIAYENTPDTYERLDSYDSEKKELFFSTRYYENLGGLDVIFDAFEDIKVVTKIEYGPGEGFDESTGSFHLADKFLYLWLKGELESVSESNTPIRTSKIIFNAKLTRGSKEAWRADYGYTNVENGARNSIKLTVGEKDNEVGRIKQNVVEDGNDYRLFMEYYPTYTYEIRIGGAVKKTVTYDGRPKDGIDYRYRGSVAQASDLDVITDAKLGDAYLVEETNDIHGVYEISDSGLRSWKIIPAIVFKPIKTVPPIVITLRKTTVSYSEPITFVNNTENLFGVYENPEISLSNGDSFPWVDNGDNTMTKEQMLDLGEYTFKVQAKLQPHLADNNIEQVKQIESVEAPKLYVLERSPYDEKITRVLDGYDLVYPRRREDVLFAPNEWITAENINRRFEYMMENLDYLVSQTKIYLKPPSKFCGFYGDFQSVINGEYRRAFGYVPKDDIEVYRLYNEHTSIEDDQTTIKNCNTLCVDTEPNLYSHQNGKISIYNTSKYESYRSAIIPALVNEYITYIDRMAYSLATKKLYLLSSRTHKLYIFNAYEENLRNKNINCTYFGEIGGYGGPGVHSKFNEPNDFFISTHKDDNGEKTDEIWICDGGNHVIKHFSIKGQWISTIDLRELGYELLGVCCDYKHNVHVLTDKYVLTFTYDGEIKNGFTLKGGLAKPLMIRPQYEAGFLYVLYEHWVDKYNLEGKYIGRFAEDEDFKYTTMCVTDNYDIYIATNKNILHYNDSLRVRTIAAVENAVDQAWKLDEIKINRDENIQDVVLNTSLQRMYDNITMYALCIFGNIVKLDSLDEDKRIADLDYVTYQKIYDFIHKERIFVGINELVTVETINRSLNQMYDLLQLMLDTI